VHATAKAKNMGMTVYIRGAKGLRFLLLALLVMAAQLSAAAFAVGLEPAGDIEVFVRDGCPHCAKAEAFLEKLHRDRPGLQIVVHNITHDPTALDRLKQIAEAQHNPMVRVPAFYLANQLIVGYSDDFNSGQLLLNALGDTGLAAPAPTDDFGSCEPEKPVSCDDSGTQELRPAPQDESFRINFFGHSLALDQVGLPLFTVAMGLLDGFNPCSMWVLILMISMLAPMQDRMRMAVVAGVFVAVEGIAYFVFMAAWLNLFLLIGLSRISEIVLAAIAIFAGAINLKDFWAFGRGISLAIPDSAKPDIYNRIRKILLAKNLLGAVIGAVVLAILVQIVELFCTSGFPALYTRILTLHQLDSLSYYGYLLLYNLAYMFDDFVILGIGVVTLSQHRLQKREGQWLKLLSGLVMVGLGLYLLLKP
jgi:glutaredoxin